jgi:hypothetical protein
MGVANGADARQSPFERADGTGARQKPGERITGAKAEKSGTVDAKTTTRFCLSSVKVQQTHKSQLCLIIPPGLELLSPTQPLTCRASLLSRLLRARKRCWFGFAA